MTPDVQAAAEQLRRFLAQADTDGIYDHTPALDVVGYPLTFGHLRTLLAALDPAEAPIGHVPTPKALDYLELRREQHPRSVRDFRGVTGPS